MKNILTEFLTIHASNNTSKILVTFSQLIIVYFVYKQNKNFSLVCVIENSVLIMISFPRFSQNVKSLDIYNLSLLAYKNPGVLSISAR